MLRLISLSVVCLALSCVSAWGAPSISGVSGTATNGQNITISGSDFGTGPTILIFDDFEGGVNGENISVGSGSAAFGQWETNERTGGAATYSNSFAHSGSLSMMCNAASGTQGLSANIPVASRKIFVSYRCYNPLTYLFPGENTEYVNWKIIWVTGTDTNDDDISLPAFIPGGGSYDERPQIGGNGLCLSMDDRWWQVSSTFTKGNWHRFWTYVEGGTQDLDGLCQMYEFSETGVRTVVNESGKDILCSGGEWIRVLVNGYTRATDTCRVFFDDVYIAYGDNARARVEMGNNATYANCTNLTICTPTSWGSSSITATVRQGSFSTGPAYLFVVDADGVVSDGYEITLGSSAGGSGWSASGTMSIH